MENRYLHLFDSIQDLNNYIINDYEEPFVALTSGTRLDFNRSPIINNNGKSYVDLGLPSGTLGATSNLEVPNTLNYRGAGGETTYKNVNYFDGNNYELGSGADDLLKYNSTDGLTSLEPEDDAARVNGGGNGRIPSVEQFQELIDNTSIDNYYSGYVRLKSNINGATIHLQKEGSTPGGGSNVYGRYGTCDLSEDDKSNARNAVFSNTFKILSYDERYTGMSIRPVLKPSPNIVEI